MLPTQSPPSSFSSELESISGYVHGVAEKGDHYFMFSV